METVEMKEFLLSRSNGKKIEEFAFHVLRNYSVEERRELGETAIEQAFTVLSKRKA